MTLTLINVINYIEIEWSSHYLTDRDRLIQMGQQINYQKEKYDQLSNSYKQSRSFLKHRTDTGAISWNHGLFHRRSIPLIHPGTHHRSQTTYHRI